MGLFDKKIQEALDRQRAELDEYYKAEDEYIRDVKLELKKRLNKSTEYRIMLRDYQQSLREREAELEKRSSELDLREQNMKKELLDLLMKDVIKLKSELSEEQSNFERQKSEWIEYEKGLRRTELTLIDWFKRIDRKERELIDELISEADRLKKYSENIPQMDGFQFEEYVAGLLMKNGYKNVVVTQKSNDYGADITAEKQEVKFVVQCKYYSSQVGIEAVQQIYAAKIHYEAHVAIVATNSIFTRAAQTLAADLGVILWDGKDIIDMFDAKDLLLN